MAHEMTELEVLVAARERIRPGYCQRDLGDYTGDGPVCALGAFCGLRRTNNLNRAELNALMKLHAISPAGDAVYFNNTHTHEEVIDLFTRAINAERAKLGLGPEFTPDEAAFLNSLRDLTRDLPATGAQVTCE